MLNAWLWIIAKLIKLKGLSVLKSNIVACRQTIKVENKVQKLLVILVFVERNNRNSIVYLVGEAVN